MNPVADHCDPLDPESVSAGEWERHARWWQANFTNGADPDYEELIVPLVSRHVAAPGPGAGGTAGHAGRPGARSARLVLDVGSGEGQVSRALAELPGLDVVGVDRSWAQLSEARSRGGRVCYARGSALDLPVASRSVDAVLACLLLEHVTDLRASLAEVARVLRSGGRFVAVINHPIVATPESGWVDDRMVDPPEQYWRLGPYLQEQTTVETVSRGIDITFHHRRLSTYLNTAVDLGLVLAHMSEPPPPPGFTAMSAQLSGEEAIPRLMALCFERV